MAGRNAAGALGGWTGPPPWLKTHPPASRKASLWKALSALWYPRQVGYPPTLHADAFLGYSVAWYQSAPVALRRFDATKSILARVVGRVSGGHQASKKNLA